MAGLIMLLGIFVLARWLFLAVLAYELWLFGFRRQPPQQVANNVVLVMINVSPSEPAAQRKRKSSRALGSNREPEIILGDVVRTRLSPGMPGQLGHETTRRRLTSM